MEMNTHLSDAELAEILLQPGSPPPEHVRQCAECRQGIERLRRTFDGLSGSARAEADRPEQFWERQRAAVWSRIAAAPTSHPLPRLVWAAALAVIGFGCLMLTTAPAPPAPQAQIDSDSDHELLMQVEQLLQTGGPEALEPVAFLVEDSSQNPHSAASSSVRKKEKNHEE